MSEDIAAEVLLEFLAGCESGIARARQVIKEAKLPNEETFDFSKLFWEQKQGGDKGPFEQTSMHINGNSDLWKKLKARVKEHGGFWQNQGYQFWFDLKNENVIDRRKIG